MANAVALMLFVSLLCVSCNDAAIEPSQSLVGAKPLPSAKILSREIIWITRGFGEVPGSLSYELRPDNLLIVTHTARHPRPRIGESVQARDTVRLSSELGAQIRRDLWRLRPEPLKGIEWETKPTGCGYAGTDDFPEYSVAFIAEGPKPGAEDDRLGLTSLPYPGSCNNRQVIEARKVLRKVLQSFPRSKAAAEFDRTN